MAIQSTTRKKWLIYSIVGLISSVTVGSVIYVSNDYYHSVADPQQRTSGGQATGQPKDDLPTSTQSVDVEVNNFAGNSPTPFNRIVASATQTAKVESTIAPPIQTTKVTVNNKLPAGDPTNPNYAAQNGQGQPAKPKLFVSGSNSQPMITPTDSTNFISQTNTSIGTGINDNQQSQQSTPYTIAAGTFIPITLRSRINTDQRGQIVAEVSRNVYDSATGKYLLIPMGATVIGTYDNNIAYGKKSVMVGWNRLIYPDNHGTSILLHGMPGTDLEGTSGLSGTVDNHGVQVYGSSAVMGAILGAETLATGNQGMLTQPSATQTMLASLGGQMGQTGLQVVQRGLNIPPTIIVDSGYRGFIQTTSDLPLKLYVEGTRS